MDKISFEIGNQTETIIETLKMFGRLAKGIESLNVS